MAESKDYIISSTEDGSVNISEDVIAIIAWEAMREVEGFGGPAAGIPGDLAELIGRRSASRGVRITSEEKSVAVDVYITVRFGYSVTKVSRDIQEAIAKSVRDMTGVAVSAVNVSVTGVAFDKTKQA
jgi:uncharacterized alkaline shock family protein YloU